MNKLILVAMLGFGIWSLGFAAFASTTSTITGPIGLIRMPSADTIGDNSYNLAVDYAANFITGTGTLASTGTWSYKMNLGTSKNLELGLIGQTDSGTNQIKDGVYVNLKYALSNDDSRYPLKLAIGAENLASSNEADTYIVASKYFKGGAVAHFGAMFDFPKNSFRPLGMAGLEYPLGGQMSNLTLIGEVFGGESLFQINAGIRLVLYPNINISVNGLNLTKNPVSKNSQSITAGICWKNPF